MPRMLVAAVISAGLLAGAAGCRDQADDATPIAAAPLADSPVGPLPGPEESPADTANPFAEDVDALGDGRRYFVAYNCAGCHGDHGGGGMGPSLRDATWLYGGTDVRVANSIAEGRAYGMPAWGRMLTTDQIWQVTAYIKSMRTRHEPEPPLE
jgi:cytochrome c oxidase cbb3-type subunit III